MEIIPVIDLKHGVVVHARRGERARYSPLVSTLCGSPEPLEVACALIDLCASHRLYIADLDAIAGNGDHIDRLEALQRVRPSLELWLDAGFRSCPQIEQVARRVNFTPVIGSETLADLESFENMLAAHPHAIVSLDFRGDALQAPRGLMEGLAGKSCRILHLNLKQVGSSAGPDMAGIAALRSFLPHAQIYSGGGVRGIDDLKQLDRMDVRGALLATALHDGSISKAAIDNAIAAVD